MGEREGLPLVEVRVGEKHRWHRKKDQDCKTALSPAC